MTGLEEAWSLNDDANFASIGKAESADELGMRPPRPAELISMGKRWMESNREAICRIVCPHEKIRSFFGTENFGLDFCSVVLDVAEHHIIRISPVPPAAVAVLFVRLGYHKFCYSYFSTAEGR